MESELFSFYLLFSNNTYRKILGKMYEEDCGEIQTENFDYGSKSFINFVKQVAFSNMISFQESIGVKFRNLSDEVSRQSLIQETNFILKEILYKVNNNDFITTTFPFIISDLNSNSQFLESLKQINSGKYFGSTNSNDIKKLKLNIETSAISFLFYELAFNTRNSNGEFIISATVKEISDALNSIFCDKNGNDFSKDAFSKYLDPDDKNDRRINARTKIFPKILK